MSHLPFSSSVTKLGHRIAYGIYCFFLSQSHHTKFTDLKYIIYIHYFFYSFFNSNVFSSLHDKILETDEKNSCISDESITL